MDLPEHSKEELEKKSISNEDDIPEKVINELLKKVKKRRKLVRSYAYFTWFCIFFVSYLGNLYIKTVPPAIEHRRNQNERKYCEIKPFSK